MPSGFSSPGGGGIPGVTVSGTPSASQALIATSGSAASWAYPPGFEIGYDQITATVNVTGTAEGSATTIITCAAHTFDGTAVLVDFYAVLASTPNVAAGNFVIVGLFESGTLINRFGSSQTPAANQMAWSMRGTMKITPTSAAHTYTVGAWATSATGTPAVTAGAGGAGANPPAFVRFTKA